MSRFRALPYAKALLEVVSADAADRTEEVVTELATVAEALEAVPDLQRAMVTPMVASDTKMAILDEVLDSLGVGHPTRRFVHVVQQHYRLEHMTDIADTFRDLVDRAEGRRRATVEVAAAPSESEQARLVAAMREVTGSDIVAEFVENPELLAGFRVQVGSKVFDGSLVGEIHRLSRETLTEQG
jgi:F-type H+-transporting ATPase subunit delta